MEKISDKELEINFHIICEKENIKELDDILNAPYPNKLSFNMLEPVKTYASKGKSNVVHKLIFYTLSKNKANPMYRQRIINAALSGYMLSDNEGEYIALFQSDDFKKEIKANVVYHAFKEIVEKNNEKYFDLLLDIVSRKPKKYSLFSSWVEGFTTHSSLIQKVLLMIHEGSDIDNKYKSKLWSFYKQKNFDQCQEAIENIFDHFLVKNKNMDYLLETLEVKRNKALLVKSLLFILYQDRTVPNDRLILNKDKSEVIDLLLKNLNYEIPEFFYNNEIMREKVLSSQIFDQDLLIYTIGKYSKFFENNQDIGRKLLEYTTKGQKVELFSYLFLDKKIFLSSDATEYLNTHNSENIDNIKKIILLDKLDKKLETKSTKLAVKI